MNYGNTLTVNRLFETDEIKRFYENWREKPVHREWLHLWRKEFRAQLPSGGFVSLNRLRNRLNFRVLKRLCIERLPVHIYQSALNWVSPNRVGFNHMSHGAYPYSRSEYVMDIDAYLNYQPHSHCTRKNEPCIGCIQNAYDLTVKVIDVIEENYKDIKLVFSGRQGFHIHCFDFIVEDHTHMDAHNMVKSHEVARFQYTSQLAEKVPEAFDKANFDLSCDPFRVMSMPESFNAVTGMSCSYLGDSKQFKRLSVDEILHMARGPKAYMRSLNIL